MKNKKILFSLVAALVIAFLGVSVYYLSHANVQVLNTKGPLATSEKELIYTALGLSLIVVIPVYALTIIFVVKYREGNKKAKYSPNLDGNWIAETIWWIIPSIIIGILAVITWQSSHNLDPYKPIATYQQPLNINVVALDWKWLFIYPSQNIAMVNSFTIPINTPVHFNLTADAPMNSFWIPQLSGQIYAMPGMNTQLYILADNPGKYYGQSANLSGSGFSGMNFYAHATSMDNFKSWVSLVKNSHNNLSLSAYNQLAKPSSYVKVSSYSNVYNSLYNSIINKYMLPPNSSTGVQNSGNGNDSSMSGMSM